MKKSRILYSILAILIGIFLFVYAEIDDSPGGQMIGLIVAIIGIVGVIKWFKGRQDQNMIDKP